ncbi:MAG TPA: PHP-associated domain-containing protein [Clostridia bacterium]|nr:PHP-associated domain-containing protein [Clostridia bacterium]
MKKFLVETHAHSSEVSSCARCDAKELTKLILKHGYSTVFVTNHLSESTIKKSGASDWDNIIDFFLDGFELIKTEANGRLNVLLSMEINFNGEDNDYLVYGITEKFLRDNKYLTEMSLRTFYPLAKRHGLYVIQAHPFRFGSRIKNPKYLDGYEIFNGNPRHNSNNDIAKSWAFKYEKLTTAGSDFHQTEDAGISGMYFDKEIKSTGDFINALKSGDYSIKY